MKSVKKVLLGLSLLTLPMSILFGQTVVTPDSSNTSLDYKTEVYRKENIASKLPIPYAYVREADVLYDKTVWRMVDLREKRNLPLYYPTKPIGSRVNLVDLLLKGIDSGELTAYDTDDPNNEFVRALSKEELDRKLGAKHDTIQVLDADGNMISQERIQGRKTDRVMAIMVKEKVYFDKKHSVMNRQVIGICPIFFDTREDTSGEEGNAAEPVKKQTFWIYMPEARPILSRHPIFNRFNDAQNQSFDDYFMQNRYDGHIYAISNVYNNRLISEYTSGLDALYEAQRITNEIFDWEQDLWEY
ncbi:MAG: gliding motility protein GldN [Bacteroidales bacterium]|jgi:gliding motility associated protien GldN|nr:gliding motility protein GldN [Bacteroidales bacterium]